MSVANKAHQIWNRFSDGQSRPAPLLFFVGCSCLLWGCSRTPEGPKRYQLSGAATFNGQPIPTGSISFEPDAAKGNSGPGSYAMIKDGRYETEQGKGIVGGAYLARVQGFDGIPYESGEGMAAEGRPLFPEQVVSLDLSKSDGTHDIDVKTSAKK